MKKCIYISTKNWVNVVELLVDSGVCSSNSDARRVISQGGVRYLGSAMCDGIDYSIIRDHKEIVNFYDIYEEFIIMKGKLVQIHCKRKITLRLKLRNLFWRVWDEIYVRLFY